MAAGVQASCNVCAWRGARWCGCSGISFQSPGRVDDAAALGPAAAFLGAALRGSLARAAGAQAGGRSVTVHRSKALGIPAFPSAAQ